MSNNNTRTKNSIKNSLTGLIGQILGLILNFVSRTIFIKVLNMDYLGVSGLFTNVLSVLSLAELGFSSAIIYSMYKPLADKNEDTISALMNLYKKTYSIIGGIVAGIGIIIIPFLGIITKGMDNIENITLIYVLFLINSVISYFFSYKAAIITADQKNYIVTFNQYFFQIIKILVQTIVLLLTHSYILYLIIQIISTFIENLVISIKANKLYPYLRKNKTKFLDIKIKLEIIKNVKAMICHKIGSVVVIGTDNILISSFVGVYWVGIYSNYLLIITAIKNIVNQMFTAITASIGNLNALETREKQEEVFNNVLFMNFMIYGNCSIVLMILINPFIKIWIGNEFVMNYDIVFLIIINFYVTGMRKTALTFKDAYGLFWNDRFKPLFEAIINLVVSIIMLKLFGIIGVFIGTLTSTILTGFWIEPYIVYKYGLKSSVSKYFKRYFIYGGVTIIAGIISSYLTAWINTNNIVCIFIKGVFLIFIINFIFLLCFINSNELKYFIRLSNKVLPIKSS